MRTTLLCLENKTMFYKEGDIVEVMTLDDVIDKELETTGYDLEVIYALGGHKCQIVDIWYGCTLGLKEYKNYLYEVVPPVGWPYCRCYVSERFVEEPGQESTHVKTFREILMEGSSQP